MSVRAAEEQGFFREEGLTNYVYECGGLLPGRFEREALPLVLKERGVDIATAVNIETAIYQRTQGTDLHIVGAWRTMPRVRLYGAKHIKGLEDLRGGKIGDREAGGITALFFEYSLRKAGIDPAKEITWVHDKAFAYRRDSAHADMLRAGKVDACQSAPPFSDQLEQEGCRLLLDSTAVYHGGRPGKIIVASSRTIEQRGDDLRAFLRGSIRGFWFVRDPANFKYMQDLESRLRNASHNEDERRLRMVTDPEHLEGWVMPVTGGFKREAVARVIDEMVTLGQLERPIPVEEVLRDAYAIEAYREVSTRPSLQPAVQKALAAMQKHGW
jgi:ABC-type nitrate/sulfonate/bicarbonate transport system substrate-binding protein